MKTAKRRVAEVTLDRVYVGNEAIDNVLHFEYLVSQLQGDREDETEFPLSVCSLTVMQCSRSSP